MSLTVGYMRTFSYSQGSQLIADGCNADAEAGSGGPGGSGGGPGGPGGSVNIVLDKGESLIFSIVLSIMCIH
jgi:hypothetical protein